MCSSFLREEGRLIFQKVLIYGSSFRIICGKRYIYIFGVGICVFEIFEKYFTKNIVLLFKLKCIQLLYYIIVTLCCIVREILSINF